ncbi:vasoactive intestinal polypeptide receptor 2-like [Poecilia reticulata]|uniref:vasoactive intestinal polypeptide receptor 2-like n=1 Tax=Poecilia reticulata TaxID=8081 RepID=UPI0007EAA644|nr:PREDICTED: vasoactive intestinal polypeptide receptor 2-like [Poecilia reticulata]
MFFPQRLALLLLGGSLIHTVDGRFPYCWLYWEMERARGECQTQLQQQTPGAEGCEGEWNNVSCWRSAAVGEVLTLPCPSPFLLLFGKNGNLSRNCTEDGWSLVYPDIGFACSSDVSDKPNELVFYRVVHILSTLGHSLSLGALITSTAIICSFRRLHCMRNYIHLNLFVSFMLRAVAVLTKDTLLFSEDQSTDCSTQPSLVGCKASLVFFNYFVMANFFWLLVEGLYLHMLLLVIWTYCGHLSVYMLIGWGELDVRPSVPVDRTALSFASWGEYIAKQPLNRPSYGGAADGASSCKHSHASRSCCSFLVSDLLSRRLAKSTLLLIPLFGVNYVVFFYLMEPDDETLKQIKIFFDLGLGSFQGLIVAVLYCFLNSEVQAELRRTWRSLSTKRCVLQDYSLRRLSTNHTGTQFPRNTRAQSILQTETTML